MIRPLHALGAADLELVGGKAANLGEALRAGVPLPPGFCVTAEVYAEIARGPVGAAIDSAIGLRDEEEASRLVRAAFRAAPLPDGVRAAITAACRELAPGDGPVAVRSSATAEDLPDASFAGQQETYLHVRGADAVCAAVQECWGSLWTPRAISYRSRQGYPHADVRLAVVVQRMIVPEVSGVMFTVDPMGSRHTHLLVDASWGLGEAIVSGRVTPDSYTLARSGAPVVSARSLGTKAIRIDGLPGGGTATTDVAPVDRARFCLDDAALSTLRDLGLAMEAHFGRPQDIEWGIEGGALYLLQSRPITSLAPEVPDFSRLGRGERFVLDDVLEHFPEAPFPADYEAVVDTLQQVQEMYLSAGLSAAHASSILVFHDDGLCAVAPRAPGLSWRSYRFPLAVLGMLRTEPGLWARDEAAAVARRLDALGQADLHAAAAAALEAALGEAEAIAAHIGRFRFVNVIAPWMLTRGILGAMTRLARRTIDDYEWLAGLAYHTTEAEIGLQALADDALAKPALRDALLAAKPSETTLFALAPDDADWSAKVAAFLHQYGARTMRLYLPFTARAWQEDASALVATLQPLVRAGRPGAAMARMSAGRERFSTLHADVLAALPRPLRGIFTRAIERFRAWHVEREATVYQIERAWVQARRAQAEIARRLVDRGVLPSPGDAMLLTGTELRAALRGSLPDARRRAGRRRERRATAVAFWRAHRVHPAVDASDGALRGQAGSPGLAEGRARVVRNPEEFGKLGPGDVLVCPYTDPAWTPLFALASAVVADTGGPLSHAAIVAREYGIPAVLGVQTGTLTLRDGELVRVDGSRGVVERLEANEAR